MHASPLTQKIESVLKTRGYRATRARGVIIEILVSASHSLSLSTIINQAVKQGINRSSVYRGLDVLAKESVASVTAPHGVPHYEITASHSQHHHHLNCQSCGRIITIHSPKLEEIIKLLSEKHHFKAHTHTFEITGLCEQCQAMAN